MGRRFLASAAVLLAASGALLFSGTAQAQQGNSNTGNGLRVAPVRNDLTVKPGESKTVDVYVQNITDIPTELRGVVNDFVASDDESGKPRVLFDEKDAAPKYGIKRFVAPINSFKLAPDEQKIIKVTIAVPKDAAGGGYFGAVRFMPVGDSEGKNVALSASVGSLILLTVPGEIREQMGVASLNVVRGEGKASNFFTNSKDLKAVIRFKNSGNVQVAPFGKMLLKKGGKEIASYEINDSRPRGSVLPDSIRRFEQSISDKTGSVGKYTLSGSFGYGDRGQLVNATTTFYVVPLPYVIAAILLVVLIIASIFVIPRMIKGHDRKLARKMRRK